MKINKAERNKALDEALDPEIAEAVKKQNREILKNKKNLQSKN